jgi:MFS family permease
VAAGFISMFTVFGVAYSFGAFFEPMAREFHAGHAATAEVFSITAFLYFGLGLVSGPAVDRFGPRSVLLLGAVAMGAGLLLTSQAHQLALAYVTYGLGVGIATACGYVPMVAVIAGWFERRRSLASGLAVSGIGLGTLVGAPLAGLLVSAYGWRSAYAALGIGAAVLLVGAALLASKPPRPATDTSFSVSELVARAEFRWLYLAVALTTVTLFTVLVYLVPSAPRARIPVSAAPILVGFLGAASTLGRVLLGFFADRFGVLRTFEAAILVMTLSCLIWFLATAPPALYAFAIVFGLGYGGFIAIGPAVNAEVLGAEHLGGKVGVSYTAAGVGALIGPPLVGLMVDLTAGYTVAIVLAIAAGAVAVSAALVGLDRG